MFTWNILGDIRRADMGKQIEVLEAEGTGEEARELLSGGS